MDYKSTLKKLDFFNNNVIKLGLSRIKRFAEMLENPQDKIPIVHVGGTNGKGSVCAITTSIVKEAGYQVGLFTSPHLEFLNERFQINGQSISDERLGEILHKIFSRKLRRKQ